MDKSTSFEYSTTDTVLSVLAIAGVSAAGFLCVVLFSSQAVLA